MGSRKRPMPSSSRDPTPPTPPTTPQQVDENVENQLRQVIPINEAVVSPPIVQADKTGNIKYKSLSSKGSLVDRVEFLFIKNNFLLLAEPPTKQRREMFQKLMKLEWQQKNDE